MEQLKLLIVNKRFVIVLFLGMIAGTLFANQFGTTHISDWGIFDSNYLEKYSSISVNGTELWKYVARDRMRDYIFLCIISLTPISISVFMMYLFYLGMGVGLVVSISSMQYGIFGVWLYIVSVFPHYICYGIALIILIKCIFNKNSVYTYKRSQSIIAVGIALTIIILGTYLEAYINPALIKSVISTIY